MHRKWVVAGGVAGVMALALGGAVFSGSVALGGGKPVGAGQAQAKKAETPLEFAAREVAQPQLATMPGRIEFSGPLVAPGTAVLKAKAGGTLVNLAVGEGARVRAGQVLGQIDLADVSSRVAERNANVAAARATLAQAERTHAQSERLATQQFISPAALDASRAALETARAQLSAAMASADMARVSLRDAALVAPIAGIVARRHVLPGEKVSPEQQVLTIVDLQKLELAGSVGTHEVGRLAPGMPVAVQVEGSDRPVQGRIARIAPAAEPGTRSIGVTIELPNPEETLRGGQYAVAGVTLDDPTQRLTVPATAVGQTSGQDHVWVIENGALARRAVMVGRRDALEGRVEVLQGLQPGSLVLAARFENLREGAKATVVAEKSAPVASAAASTPVLK
jgi:RND family efflux transporter MFP subunit